MKVEIEDFQSLAAASLDVEGLTVVVGRSNLGKSALIRAVEGALFNRPGDDFVRKGASSVQVTLTDVPSGPEKVVWEKGSVNRFTINGQVYDKVGQVAPPPLTDAGYRDVFVGDRSRKGETIRPQVAGQFDPLFLLTRTGSFVSDVLSEVSRLSILTMATGRCSKDLRATKQLLGVRRGDLVQAVERRDRLAGVPALQASVRALVTRARALDAEQQRLVRIKALVGQRDRIRTLRQFVRGLAVVRTAVPPTLGWTPQSVRRLVSARQTLAALWPVTLPPVFPVATIPDPQRIQQLHRLAPVRGGLAAAVAAGLPVVSRDLVADSAAALQAQALQARFTELVARRDRDLQTVFDAERGVRSIKVTEEEAQAELAMELAALKVCPVCEQPMRKKRQTGVAQ